ncbi:MAG: FimV/HubP family polar landmark protein [Propionivibrio sp.]
MGKIVVFSALGQPLRAEIEVAASREELADMKAQLASPEVFKQAGLDYATTLLGINFSIDRRSNGKAVIKLNSDSPINDPFIDLLLELNWATGRLVREYTFLLDPPEMMVKGSVPVAPSQAKPAVSRSTASPNPVAGIDDEVRGKAVARVRAKDAEAQQPAQPSDGSDAREVRRGDTLHKIALETKPAGVSLEQMLVGLLRANESAFEGGNMNRLKAGKILTVPNKSVVESVPAAEAKKIVVAQSADWNAYRNKMAGMAAQAPVTEEASKQEAAGKITAKVEDKAAPAETPKDQLKVSKTESGGSKAAEKQAEEDLIAKEKALKEANERLSTLEKNLADLQKLVELKNQNLADLQKQATDSKTEAPPVKPAETPKPSTPEAAPVAPVPTEVVSPAPVEAAAPAVEKPVEPAKVEETKPEPKKPVQAPKPKPVAPPPPPPEEPGFIEGLLKNPLPLAGIGGVLALIAAFFVARRRRAGKEEVPLNLGTTLTPSSTSLTGNSVFRSTGGQSVDTSQTPAQTDFSQAGPGSIDTDEVDPVAEADVYMAYGRDAQAEEILLEAKQKDPKRLAIHLKLLEIYSNRKDLKQFESLATELYSETGGVGADWEKAAAMGLRLDPENPLFGAKGKAPAAFDADATVIVPSLLASSTVTMPGALSQLAEEALPAPAVAPAMVEEPAPVADLASLDFDLGFGDVQQANQAEQEPEVVVSEMPPVVEQGPLDFDLGIEEVAAEAEPLSTAADELAAGSDIGLDFDLPVIESTPPVKPQVAETSAGAAGLDLDLGSEPAADAAQEYAMPQQAISEPKPATVVEDDGVEFDVSLTELTFLGRSVPDSPSFDMASIDLDLGVPEIPEPAPPVLAPESVSEIHVDDFDSAQVATAVNPDFATEQSETIVSPNFASEPEADLLPEQDFSIAQLETQLNETPTFDLPDSVGDDFATAQEETVVNPQFGENEDLLPEFEISANEEVATKLDLAKAYEEMGDFEGASELLQEVLKEGDAAQREKAQAILAKINI